MKAATLFTISMFTLGILISNPVPALAQEIADCGPPSTTIPGPPPELISVDQPMPGSWLLCYIWQDIEAQDYRPDRFGEVRQVRFEGYPGECGSGISEDGDTEGLEAEIFAFGDNGLQYVRFVYRMQLDGDYIHNCAQELQ